MDLSEFPTLLDKAFLEFRIRQTKERLSVSLNSFAGFLEFSPTIINLWLKGKKTPSESNMDRIIPKLVELIGSEVYDVLNLPRPDLDLKRLTDVWERIPETNRRILADLAEKYAVESEQNTAQLDLPLQNQVEQNPPEKLQ
jgi:hypothetical protein